jgi:hypothetical protein
VAAAAADLPAPASSNKVGKKSWLITATSQTLPALVRPGPRFPHAKPGDKDAICVERLVLVKTEL